MKAYGELQLTAASPPQTFAEPLTVDQVKQFLRISQTEEDDLFATFITAARSVAEIAQGVDLIPKQYDLSLDLLVGDDYVAGSSYPIRQNIYSLVGDDIRLRYPLRSVDLFQYTDSLNVTTTLTENTDYLVDKNRAVVTPPFGKLWSFFAPRPTSAVLIRFTSGYSSTHPFWSNNGQMVLMGMRMLIAGWSENRIPFDGALRGQVSEYPYTITDLLGYGARPRVH